MNAMFVSTKKCFFILTSSHSLDKKLYGWVQLFGFNICVILPWSYLIVFLFEPFIVFFIPVLYWWTVSLSGKRFSLLGLDEQILWFIICILIVKNAISNSKSTHRNTLKYKHSCVLPHKSTRPIAEIFLYLKSNPRCILNIRNMYYYKTTGLVNALLNIKHPQQ